MEETKNQAIAKMELDLKLGEDIEGVECTDIKVKDIAGTLKLGETMVQFCAESGGAGLAAPQVGFTKNLIIWMSKENMFQVGFNPRLYKNGKKIHTVEGCLSYPEEQYFVSRWKEIVAVYYVPDKEKEKLIQISKRMKGEEAIIFQHETDHLSGKTIATRGKLIKKKKNEVVI